MRATINKAINGLLRPASLELRRIQPALPSYRMIDQFAMCAERVLAKIPQPFVLQIGANDGITNDPVHDLIVNNDLPSLLIEPHPVAFAALQSNYVKHPNVVVENVAIASVDGTLPFYVPDDKLAKSMPRTHRLCSFSKKQLITALIGNDVTNPESRIKVLQVPTRTVPTILDEHKIKKVDILQIDVESLDWKVLSQFDLNALGVSLINIEFFALAFEEKQACVKHLSSLGYEMGHFFGDLVAFRT
jgi:FkbM family methyltransferase